MLVIFSPLYNDYETQYSEDNNILENSNQEESQREERSQDNDQTQNSDLEDDKIPGIATRRKPKEMMILHNVHRLMSI